MRRDTMIDINITFFIQCINFLVSLYLLNLLIVGPIRSIMARRCSELERAHVEIEHIRSEVEALCEKYNNAISEANMRANEQQKITLEKAKIESAFRLEKAKEHTLARSLAFQQELSQEVTRISEEFTESIYSLSDTIIKRLVH